MAQSAINLPLHAASEFVGAGDLLSRSRRVSRAAAQAILNAPPIIDRAGPVALLVVDPKAGLVVVVGPIATAELVDRWLHERSGLEIGDYRCIPLPLATPSVNGGS